MAYAVGCIVVTGCTSGLGFECVKSLAAATLKRNTVAAATPTQRIVLACRNVAAASAAADRICAATGAARDSLVILPESLDLTDLTSVRAYAGALLQRTDLMPIAALINNAGIGTSAIAGRSKNGYEAVFATNHLGHFLLTTLLLSSMSKAGARIVNVSSEVHNPATKTGAPDPGQNWPADDLAQLAHDTGKPGDSVMTSTSMYYSRSKLCNVLFTYELNRRLQAAGTPITVVAMNPGLMLETGFFQPLGPVLGTALWLLAPVVRLVAPFARHSHASGAALAQIATSPDHASTTAVFYDTTYAGVPVVSESSVLSHDKAQQAGLWVASLKLARVSEAELAAAGL